MSKDARPDPASASLLTLKAAAQAAAGASTVADYLQDATERMSLLVGSASCSLLVVRDGHLWLMGAVGLPRDYLDAIDGTRVGPDVGTCGRAAALGRACVTPDIHQDPNWTDFRDLADAAGLRACWSVPLKGSDGSTLGTFATYSTVPLTPSIEQLELAEAHASLVALGLERLRHEERVNEGYESVVVALSSVLDVRDEYTAAHSAEAAALAESVGRRLGLDGGQLRTVEQVALLHDIGKLGIPTEILKSPRPLTREQWSIVRQHPIIGERILAGVPHFEEVARAVRHEHERWDGQGYPDGLGGDRIPLPSRIVFACDAWNAMSSDRPYRPALDREVAIRELQDNAGSQFDPDVVEALLATLGEDSLAGQADACERDDTSVLRLAAEEMGAEDLFVFRKVSPEKFTHFGGVGRGEGWAGNIELSSFEEPHFVAAIESGEVVKLAFEGRQRIVGPYYARSALIVARRHDFVVVFGSSTDSLRGASAAGATLQAARAATVVDQISPAKRLADELEVLEAVRSITTISGDDLEDTLSRVADAAAGALSCEFGAIIAFGEGAQPRFGFAERGWTPADPDALDQVLVPFAAGEVELPLLVQDVTATDLVPGLFRERGATSIHALPVGGDASLAVMVLVHADPVPRGFTVLCQRVARAVSDAAEIVIRRALVQEELARENARLTHRVRTDALTGVASRAAWDEALRREELHRARSHAPTAIAVFDIDGLKTVNDTEGHSSGDALIKACAEELARGSRATDLVARIGGDEFAVLLRYTGEEDASLWCARVAQTLNERSLSFPELKLSLASGVASVPPAGTLREAFDEADRRMYAAKQRLADRPVSSSPPVD